MQEKKISNISGNFERNKNHSNDNTLYTLNGSKCLIQCSICNDLATNSRAGHCLLQDGVLVQSNDHGTYTFDQQNFASIH